MRAYHQQGVVLLMALVFLLILTVAGVSAMRLASVEERMTSNFTERNIAFQSAEAALIAAETRLQLGNFQQANFFSDGTCGGSDCFYNEDAANNPTCSNGLCFLGTFTSSTSCVLNPVTSPSAEIYQSASLWNETSTAYQEVDVTPVGTETSPTDTVNPARYIIEFRCFAVKDPLNITGDQYDTVNQYNATYWEPYYRITAMGYGRNETTRIMLQSTFRRDRGE